MAPVSDPMQHRVDVDLVRRLVDAAGSTFAGCPVLAELLTGTPSVDSLAGGELRLNSCIAMGPMPLVGYVVVHEVGHLVVTDYPAAFWKLLGTILPDLEA